MPRNNEIANSRTEQYLIAERRERVAALYLQGNTQRAIGEIVGFSRECVYDDLRHLREGWQANAAENFGEKQAVELAKIDRMEAVAWDAWERSCQPAEIENTRTDKVQSSLLKGNPNGVSGSRWTPRGSGSSESSSSGNSSKGSSGQVLTKKEAEEIIKSKNSSIGKRVCGSPTDAGEDTLIPIKETVSRTVKGQTGDPRFLDRIAWCIEMRLRMFGLIKEEKGATVTLVNLNWAQLVGQPEETPAQSIEQRIAAVAIPHSNSTALTTDAQQVESSPSGTSLTTSAEGTVGNESTEVDTDSD